MGVQAEVGVGMRHRLQLPGSDPLDVAPQSGGVLQHLEARAHELSAAVEEQLTVPLGLGASGPGQVAGQDRPAQGGRDLVGPSGMTAGDDVPGEILHTAEPLHHGPHLIETEARGAVGAHQHPAGIGATVPHRQTVMAQQPGDRVPARMSRERVSGVLVVLDPARFVQIAVGVLDRGRQQQGSAMAGLLHPGGEDTLPRPLEPDQPAEIRALRTCFRIAPAAASDQSDHASTSRHPVPPFSNRDRIGQDAGWAAVP